MLYTLDTDGRPVAEPDVHAYLRWVEANGDRRRVAFDTVAGVLISTVFLGYEIAGPGVVFETMISRSAGESWSYPSDNGRWFYATREEALRGHAEAVAFVSQQDD